jgi:hypothetical protein
LNVYSPTVLREGIVQRKIAPGVERQLRHEDGVRLLERAPLPLPLVLHEAEQRLRARVCPTRRRRLQKLRLLLRLLRLRLRLHREGGHGGGHWKAATSVSVLCGTSAVVADPSPGQREGTTWRRAARWRGGNDGRRGCCLRCELVQHARGGPADDEGLRLSVLGGECEVAFQHFQHLLHREQGGSHGELRPKLTCDVLHHDAVQRYQREHEPGRERRPLACNGIEASM